ncbi:hypothetical protein A2U01_0094656, partial [Trifolium medium]|nr:hypothetical protein [Trifolium medium]
MTVGVAEEDESSEGCDFAIKVIGDVLLDSRAMLCVMVDSSNSNRDFAVSNVGKGSCCWMYVTNPAYES